MKKPKSSIFPFAKRAYAKKLLSKNETLLKILSFRFHFAEKRYTASDTPLSYRQINSLGGNGILRSDRKNQKGWRKFSFRELVFLLVVEEIRKYGIQDSQLKYLRDAFFKKENKFESDLAMMASVSGIKIILTFDADGKVYFHDVITADMSEDRNHKSFINVNLNAIIAGQWKKEGRGIAEYKNSADIFGHELGKHILKEKEIKIINSVRDGNYESIKIKFKDGKVFMLEKTENMAVSKRMVDMKKEHAFQNISTKMENGKTVSIKRTSKEKL